MGKYSNRFIRFETKSSCHCFVQLQLLTGSYSVCRVCTAHTGYEMFTTTVELWQNVLRSENVPAKVNFTYESINLKRTTQVEDKKKR